MKRFPFFLNDIGGKVIEEKIKSILLRSETFHRMPILNNVLNTKELIKLNTSNFLHKFILRELHIQCPPSTLCDKYCVKKTYDNGLIKKTNRIRLLFFYKNGKFFHDVKKRKLTRFKSKKKRNKFVTNSGKKFLLQGVHIDMLNEELKSVEKKINEKNIIENKDKKVTSADFKYPSQRLYKANEEEINLIRKSEGQYYLPLECENSTIIRLIDIKNKVSSPIFRCVRNSKFGLRKNERTFFFYYSSFICSFFFSMGIWQYKKMEKKKFLIDYILHNLNKPIIVINDFDFPWFDDFLILKKNYKILNENLAQYDEKESKLLSSINLLEIVLRVLTFYEKVRVFHGRIIRKKKDLCCNDNSNNKPNGGDKICVNEADEKKGEEGEDAELYNKKKNVENGNKLTVDLENISSVYEWINRIRNENALLKLYRKMSKKDLTEDELKKLVLEKYKYRKVQLTGVLDTTKEFYIGPKIHEFNKKKKYYYVICPLFLKSGKCILVNRGLISEEILEEKKNEIPKIVTLRGILDPGELYECPFKKIKNFSNKSVYSNYFFYYDTEEICQYANISDLEGSSFFIANIYDIIFHEDYNNDIRTDYYSNYNKGNTKELDSNLKKLNDITINDMDRESQERIKRLLKNSDSAKKAENGTFQNIKPFRYDEHFIHKKKKEYFKFYADETTHFNYACQWFLFAFVFSTISVFKFIQLKKWIF
ncbi:SURF1 domain-containing protein [Plasmodium brasilianum]|nr:SURF1 domain-containing protein [Plasmodium brasilianum]